MEALIETLFTTEWGIIILCWLILTAVIIEFFKNKPKT